MGDEKYFIKYLYYSSVDHSKSLNLYQKARHELSQILLVLSLLEIFCWLQLQTVQVQGEVSQTVVLTLTLPQAGTRLSPLCHGDTRHLLHKHLRHLPRHLLLHLLVILVSYQLLDSFTESEIQELPRGSQQEVYCLEVFLVPSFLFMLGPRSQPGSYRPRELIFPILSCGVLLQIRSGSAVSLSMLKGFSGLALAMARRVLLVLGLVSWFTCTLTSLLQSLWSSLSPSLLRALLVQLAEDVMQFKLRGLA